MITPRAVGESQAIGRGTPREWVVLTQNLWGGAPFWGLRRRSLARGLARLRPDVVGLQEVHAPDPVGETSQAHQLADRAGGYRVVFAPGRVTPSGRCEGVAILSRHPIVGHSVEALTMDRGDLLDRLGRRVVLHAVVESPAGPIDTFVTHLSVSRRARARTIHELLAFTARACSHTRGRGAILMGDLNAPPGESIVAALEGGDDRGGGAWRDAWKLANGPDASGGTYPAPVPYRRIDYILLRPHERWQVLACNRMPAGGSDHLGVVARLAL